MLTDEIIRSLQPQVKDKRVFDSRGLYFLVTSRGARVWRFRFRFPLRSPETKETYISLGRYPDITLERAREIRDLACRDIANGVDPRLRRVGGKLCEGGTFEVVAREFLSILRKACVSAEATSAVTDLIQQTKLSPHYRRPRTREPISVSTVKLMQRRLELHVFPYIGARQVQNLSAPELLKVLRQIESRGTYDLAHRVRAICSRVFRFARATGRHCEDVTADLAGALIPVTPEHIAAIVDPEQVGELLRAIDSYRGDPVTRLALRLLPYTFPRPVELRTMEWSHVRFVGVAPEWRVPWRRMKTRLPHIVPLSRQAAAILRELHSLTGHHRWVFPQKRFPARPMSASCINVALRSMGYNSTEMTGHGFRSLASTQLHELGWNDSWIETQLAHADRNKVGSAYNHAKYLSQRRAMMQGWADYLDRLCVQTETAVSHEMTAQMSQHVMEALADANTERAKTFQDHALAALHDIVALSKRH